MARGTAQRAPSQNAYKGLVGQTQTETVHVTSARGDLIAATVHTTIDAVNDPDLVERLFSDTLNELRVDGTEVVTVAVPLVYHDPAAEVFVLVLGEAQRHREIDERIRLLERLRADRAGVPAYVKEFAVVFGPTGLRHYLEQKAQHVLALRDVSKERSEIQTRETDLQRAQQQLAQQQKDLERSRAEHELALADQRRAAVELERATQEIERGKAELERSKGELERMRAEARARVIAAVQQPEATVISPAPSPSSERDDIVTKPIGRHDVDEIETALQRAMPLTTGGTPKRADSDFATEQVTRFEAAALATHTNGTNGASVRPLASFDAEEKTGDDGASIAASGVEPRMETREFTSGVEIDEEPTGNSMMPAGADPLVTETRAIEIASGDRWVDAAGKVQTSTFAAKDGVVRLALVAGDHIARGLTGNLDIRVLLHRLPSYPVVTVVIGPPAALRTPSPTQLIVVPLDVAAEADRMVLMALAKKFEITTDIVAHGKVTRRVQLTAPLAENVAYIIRAADDHLRGITADGETEPSYVRARDIVLGAGYDLLGVEHAEASEFRDDKLATLETAQHLRRAMAIARRFARPSREDYLVCARGYPLQRWRELRRQVLERAVAWGIWMGPELAQVAVSEGFARSRRDLIMKLDQGFEALRKTPEAYDLDDDAADDNLKAVAEEARALGVELRARKSNGAIKSEDVSTVSGSIDRKTPPKGTQVRSTDELLALLDDKIQRVSAATELCDRGDARAAAHVIGAVKKMSRAEAVRILGKSVKFGAPAAQPLIEGLQSSKAFLRHGCALALALLRTDEGTHAVIEQLINEPTEIWREIARAIGQIGPTALMPLASHVGRLGDRMTPQIQERVAWAMAHVGVRGGKSALDQMAAGQSVMAPIARQALDLHSNAARDEVKVRPGPQATKDVTVNRAFSRRFFEALEADRPDVAQAALHDLDASSPHEVLDENDLIVEEEEEAELDESDLIQT